MDGDLSADVLPDLHAGEVHGLPADLDGLDARLRGPRLHVCSDVMLGSNVCSDVMLGCNVCWDLMPGVHAAMAVSDPRGRGRRRRSSRVYILISLNPKY